MTSITTTTPAIALGLLGLIILILGYTTIGILLLILAAITAILTNQ
jgi:energy-converting hydrogenase Eha subunit A